MTGSEDMLPTKIANWLKDKNAELSFEEELEVFSYLETQYELEPCNEIVVQALIRLFVTRGENEKAKQIGRSFLTMNGYSKAVLSELSLAYMNTDEMDTYFSLVRFFTDEEKEPMEESSDVHDNVIPFPKKMLLNSSRGNWLELSPTEQLEFLQKLRFESISPFLEEFRSFLVSDQASPFVQSIVFELLQEKGIDQPFKVKKLGQEGDFTPSELPLIGEDEFAKELFRELRRLLESENPSLLDQLTQTLQHHIFMIYPFSFHPKDAKLWAQAYFAFAEKLYSGTLSKPMSSELENAVSFIEDLEEQQQNYLL